MTIRSRREFLALSAAAATLVPRRLPGAQGRRLEGIFPIMQTPFTESGRA